MWHSVFPSTILEMFMYISCFFSVFCYWISYSISLVKTTILDIKLYLRCTYPLPLPRGISVPRFCLRILVWTCCHGTPLYQVYHDDVIKWKHSPRFCPVTCGFPSQRPMTRSFDGFFWCAPEQTLEQTVEMAVIWDVVMLIMTSLQWFLRHSVGVFQDLRLVFLAMINR